MQEPITMEQIEAKHNCPQCAARANAEAKPNSFMARLWRFHTRFCPGWKAYQADLAKLEAQQAAAES
jgi:hypothetical protein